MFNLIIITSLAIVGLSLYRGKNRTIIEQRKNRMLKESAKFSWTVKGKPAEVIPVVSKSGERYSELNSSLEDIKFAKNCFMFLLNGDKPPITYVQIGDEPQEEDIITGALFKAAIISYARAFVSTSTGRCQLGVEELNQHEKRIHQELLHIRHTFVAHAGYAAQENSLEFIGTYILLDPEENEDPAIIAHNRRANSFSSKKIQEFINLIDKVISIYKRNLIKMKRNIYREEIKAKK